MQWAKVSGPGAIAPLDRHWMRYLRVALLAAAVVIAWRILAWQEDGYFVAASVQVPPIVTGLTAVPTSPAVAPPPVTTTVPVVVISPTPTPTSTPVPTPTPAPTPTPPTHTVRLGDTLSEISFFYDVTIDAILEINDIPDRNNLVEGQVLVLPPDANVDPERLLPSVYVVQPGDTLSAIAVALGVTMQELMDANSTNDPNSILVGQELIVPGGL
jgi:LysM repeat protein